MLAAINRFDILIIGTLRRWLVENLMLSHEEVQELSKRLLKVTEPGPVSQWIDRMGEIARKLNLPLEHIKWNTFPWGVAYDVANMANCSRKADELKEIVSKMSGN